MFQQYIYNGFYHPSYILSFNYYYYAYRINYLHTHAYICRLRRMHYLLKIKIYKFQVDGIIHHNFRNNRIPLIHFQRVQFKNSSCNVKYFTAVCIIHTGCIDVSTYFNIANTSFLLSSVYVQYVIIIRGDIINSKEYRHQCEYLKNMFHVYVTMCVTAQPLHQYLMLHKAHYVIIFNAKLIFERPTGSLLQLNRIQIFKNNNNILYVLAYKIVHT